MQGITAELKYWLWLSSLVWLRPRVKLLLLEALGGAREVFFSSETQVRELNLLTESELERFGRRSLDFARKTAELCDERDIGIVTLRDAAYPQRLAGIYDPPVVLYVRGKLPQIDELASVAIVGTRRATPYGLKMAARLGYEITRCGGAVVSGLTPGIDAAAAKGALMAGGGCVGVLGTPIDDDGWGGELARDVELTGAVVSEYPPGVDRYNSFFRARNRISAGLSIASVVVEAPARSGALLFAQEATSQGREVFVVPGNADSASSEGSNGLLMDGAPAVRNGWDVLCGYAASFPNLRDPGEFKRRMPREQEKSAFLEKTCLDETQEEEEPDDRPKREKRKRVKPASETEKDVDKAGSEEYIDLGKLTEGLEGARRAVALAIDRASVHIDDIVEKTGLPVQTVLRELTMLQLEGLVGKTGDKSFTLIQK